MKKILLLFICAIFLPGISSAQTVTNTNDGGPGSLRHVILNVIPGATITVDPSLAGQTVTLATGPLSVPVNMTIVGADGFEVSGNNTFRIFNFLNLNTTVSISNMTMSNGFVSGFGSGGVGVIAGSLTLTDCVLTGNIAYNAGAIRVSEGGQLILNRCTFSGNSTSGNSGGALSNSGDLLATNCTFSGNTVAGSNRSGGAIVQYYEPGDLPSTAKLNNCTVTGNTATGDGGGIYEEGSSIELSNTIVAGNSAPNGPDIFGSVVTSGNNLIENISGITFSGTGTGDITGISAVLGPLAANGGLTETHSLLVMSPAIDAGSVVTAAMLDQRELARFGAPDIGAFELNGIPGSPPVPDSTTLPDLTAECSVVMPTAPTSEGGMMPGTTTTIFPVTAQGTTVVTWSYTNAFGTTTQTQNVVITDATAPVADLVTLAEVTAECEVTALTAPTATDNCGGTVTVTNDATLPITTQGTTVVTWTYTDAAGNSSTQTQNVVITDATAPVADLVTLAEVTAECEVTSLTAPTATDNCGGTVTVTNDATLPITTQGTTVVTWTYTDAAGNSSTQTQNVVITDATAPVADLVTLADVTGTCSIDMPTAPTAMDNCTGTITGTTTTIFPITAIGTTTIIWEYDDGNGNMTTQLQDVVNAGVDPSTTLSGDGATITANTAGASYAWVNCDANVTIAGETGQSFTPSATGSYAVIVTVGNCSDTSICEILIYDPGSGGYLVTPNGDGINESFAINGFTTNYPANEIFIYNRWGNLIYQIADYQNDWSGEVNVSDAIGTSDLPEGTYYFLIQASTTDNSMKGFIYVKY